MKLDPQQLTDSAKRFEQESTELADAAKRAMDTLNALGMFWGDDEYGKAFYNGKDGNKGYGAASQEATSFANAITKANAAVADGLLAMAKNIDAANWGVIVAMLPEVPK